MNQITIAYIARMNDICLKTVSTNIKVLKNIASVREYLKKNET